jgi:hypothetical protein
MRSAPSFCAGGRRRRRELPDDVEQPLRERGIAGVDGTTRKPGSTTTSSGRSGSQRLTYVVVSTPAWARAEESSRT